ncbi:MAG: hypothetical protein M0Z66_09910 [Thermaerobacter sp.]|nr:hypothetical protein [Thermaerobacter sp.]
MPESEHADDRSRSAVIGIVGDYSPSYSTHRMTIDALGHVPSPLPFEWVPTATLKEDVSERLSRYAGLLIAPGSPYVSMDGALRAIRFARERRVPLTGT